MIEVNISDASAFIVHDDEAFFAQLPKWIKVEFAPYNGRSKYVSKIEYGTPSYEKLGMLWDDPNRPMYNTYPTMKEVYRVSKAVYNDCFEQLNDKLDELSKYTMSIGGDKGNPIIRKSISSFRYATQISWGVFSENTSNEEIIKVLNSHF